MENTYDQEELPVLTSSDSWVSIAQLQSPAPTSCPWLSFTQRKSFVQVQLHDQGGQQSGRVWIHSTERYKEKEKKKITNVCEMFCDRNTHVLTQASLRKWNVFIRSVHKNEKHRYNDYLFLNHNGKFTFFSQLITQTRV